VKSQREFYLHAIRFHLKHMRHARDLGNEEMARLAEDRARRAIERARQAGFDVSAEDELESDELAS
jgi:hypothetical protein